MSEIRELIKAWQPFINSITDWQNLVKGVTPKDTGCGLVYELQNPINRPNESLAIVDMRSIGYVEPHYHGGNETEIQFVLNGRVLNVIGTEQKKATVGSVIIIPPSTSYFAVPDKNTVLIVINSPPHRPENYVILTRSNKTLKYNHEQFLRLTEGSN